MGMKSARVMILILFITICVYAKCDETMSQEPLTKKVLLFPFQAGFSSHQLDMIQMGKLFMRHGYETTLLMSETTFKIHRYKKTNATIFRSLEYSVPRDLVFDMVEFGIKSLKKSIIDKDATEMVNWILRMIDVEKNYCESFLNDVTLMNCMKENNFNLIVVDQTEYCGRALVEILDIPAITYATAGFGGFATIFHLPTIFPNIMTDYSTPMTFMDRLKNIGHTIIFQAVQVWTDPFCGLEIQARYNISGSVIDQPMKTILAGRGSTILNTPQPLLPNVILIGDILKEDPKPLESDYLHFADNALEGLVVVCFGTIFSRVLEGQMHILARALGRLPYRVIWCMEGWSPQEGEPLGSNIMVSDYIPQNDLLAHKNTKAFVSHCGQSSVYEAIHNAVPVVAVPLAFDQPYQAQQLVRLGMAQKMSIADITETALVKAITSVAENPELKSNALRTRHLLYDQPIDPLENFFKHVEYVQRYPGLPHFQIESLYSMNLFQIWGVDLICFVILICVGCLLLLIVLSTLAFNSLQNMVRFFRKSDKLD